MRTDWFAVSRKGTVVKDDWSAVVRECRRAKREGTVISDGCARTVGALYHEALVSVTFSTTGAVPVDSHDLWSELFPDYDGLSGAAKTVADMMAVYLGNHAGRGPVPGWSSVWVGRS